jgi:Family of unknown function (DUF6293)
MLIKANNLTRYNIDHGLEILRIHIAPIGFEVDRIVLPAIAMKSDRVWLIIHNDPKDSLGKSFRDNITGDLDKHKIEYQFENTDRADLFDTFRALKTIISKEKKNTIFINVSTGSKIQAIACMMACMMFKDEVNIKPYYAEPEKYATTPKEQETIGLKRIITLPEYKIEIPSNNLIDCLTLIYQRKNNTITQKDLKDKALEKNLIHLEKTKNRDQSAYMALSKNLLEPLLLKWKFIKVQKVGRHHNVSLTEEGLNALRFLHTDYLGRES